MTDDDGLLTTGDCRKMGIKSAPGERGRKQCQPLVKESSSIVLHNSE